MDPETIGSNFEILKKKCQSKLDCLIFEMFFSRKLKPNWTEWLDPREAIHLIISLFISFLSP